MIKSKDEQLVDILFCGIKEEPCEKTIDLTSIKSIQVNYAFGNDGFSRRGIIELKADAQTCDDVCELFGGPPTKWEKFKAYIRLNIIFPIKKNFKLFYFTCSNDRDLVEYHLSLYIFRKQIIDKTWQHRKINSQQSN